jgi:hypothetical protein
VTFFRAGASAITNPFAYKPDAVTGVGSMVE